MGPADLAKVMSYLPSFYDPNVLIGHETSDDVAVYRINDDIVLVQSVDYFTPVVNDPYDFGAIGAANSFSDLYAKGVKPLVALNLVGFPAKTIPLEVLGMILRGGVEKAKEAGVSIVGGHSIDDQEPKYGLCVSGIANWEKIISNSSARPGDALILTKPLGTGIITTAIKREMAPEALIKQVTKSMATLNNFASQAMIEIGVNSATDVTGFGLLGHLLNMIKASGVGADIFYSNIPIFPESRDLAKQGIYPGGTNNNREFLEKVVDWQFDFLPEDELILFDPQTSGGLLISVSQERKNNLLRRMAELGVYFAQEIGRIRDDNQNRIRVYPKL